MSHLQDSQSYVILVGTDFSDASKEAISQALDTALERDGSIVHVLHVLDTGHVVVLAEMSEVPVVPEPQLLASTTAKLREHVREQLEAHGNEHATLAITSHVRFGEAAEEIAQFASDVSANLVVVGTHPRHGASRWLIGSVAEKVVRTAPCPVLVARHVDTSRPHDPTVASEATLTLPFPVGESAR